MHHRVDDASTSNQDEGAQYQHHQPESETGRVYLGGGIDELRGSHARQRDRAQQEERTKEDGLAHAAYEARSCVAMATLLFPDSKDTTHDATANHRTRQLT